MECFKVQRGSAMIEFCVAMLPIIMLGSLILEVAYWHTARQRLALAFSQAVDLATMHNGAKSVAWQHLKKNRPELNIKAQDVNATADTTALFYEFADSALSQQYGQPTIRHDFLMAQHEKFKSQGWSSGRGPRSGKTILEANTLSLTVTGWHKPYLPWLGAAMRLWQGHNRIAIRLTQSALMQSHRFEPHVSSREKKVTPNISDQKFIQPYIPRAWKEEDRTGGACGAHECCSEEPANSAEWLEKNDN